MVGARVERARATSGLSQRALAAAAGLSQSTLSRIISGDRTAKVPELIAIGRVTGHTVAELSGTSTVADRVLCAARSTNGAGMDAIREALVHFAELDAFLADQGLVS